ncbi:MAG TPA: PTS sugar transporter subunit IIA [Treponemataceae bacterium]|nr:PTS sugar transporter subunit IIA [Treponemataceae bacterium]
MILRHVFTPGMININLLSEDKDEVFEEMIEEFVAFQPELDRSELLESIQEREDKMSTGIIPGIAVPHGKTASISGIKGAIGLSADGIDYDSLDQKPVHAVFMLISSPENNEDHLQVLKVLAQILEDRSFYRTLMAAKTPEEVCDIIYSFEEQYTMPF